MLRDLPEGCILQLLSNNQQLNSDSVLYKVLSVGDTKNRLTEISPLYTSLQFDSVLYDIWVLA